MKTKYTVSKTGWSVGEEDHKQIAETGYIDKLSIANLLDDNLFFDNKKDVIREGGSPIKRNVKITVVITDVVAKEKKKK